MPAGSCLLFQMSMSAFAGTLLWNLPLVSWRCFDKFKIQGKIPLKIVFIVK